MMPNELDEAFKRHERRVGLRKAGNMLLLGLALMAAALAMSPD